jgi:Zn-dependent peptidase ImmA (M78 family)/DNA-binding XRE family transcriptional regulator
MTATPAFSMATNSPSEIGARIKRAREQQGLTQGELGERVGKTQTAISYWEAGRRSPDVDDIVAVADALDVEVTYFFGRTESKPRGVLLRAQATLRPFDNLIAEIERFAAEAEDLESFPREIQVKNDSPTKAAQQLLAKTRTTHAPIPISQLAERCGVNVTPAQFSNEISGVLLDLDNGPVIGFNNAHHPVRQRFTIAHELGHFLLDHHDHFHIDLSDAGREGDPPGYNWHDERSANEFAAQVLMPAALIVQAFEEDSNLNRIAKLFNVSREAMGWRLVNLGLLG